MVPFALDHDFFWFRGQEQKKIALEEIKNEATTTSDKLQVQTQLRYINQDIEMLQGQKEYYEKSTSYSTLTLEIREGSGVSLFSWNYYVQRALSWIEAIIAAPFFNGMITYYIEGHKHHMMDLER